MIKFACIGIASFIVNLVIQYIVVEKIHYNYIFGQIISFSILLPASFFAHRVWTFSASDSKWQWQGSKYIITMVFNMFINLLLMKIIVDYIGIYYLYATAIVTLIFFIFNFFVQKLLVFSPPRRTIP